ncbi:hypothetical protein GCM10007285_14570 [Stappia taiwanensis]|nr:hypothetical protein GCM10007285_14570 [Stappia taiwanensis]
MALCTMLKLIAMMENSAPMATPRMTMMAISLSMFLPPHPVPHVNAFRPRRATVPPVLPGQMTQAPSPGPNAVMPAEAGSGWR